MEKKINENVTEIKEIAQTDVQVVEQEEITETAETEEVVEESVSEETTEEVKETEEPKELTQEEKDKQILDSYVYGEVQIFGEEKDENKD